MNLFVKIYLKYDVKYFFYGISVINFVKTLLNDEFICKNLMQLLYKFTRITVYK